MQGSIAYLFAIILVVLTLNIYFVYKRMKKGNQRRKRNRVSPEEAKQAIWRDKEIARRIQREHDDALERFILRNETLAFYEEVRRRHAEDDKLESLSMTSYENEVNIYSERNELKYEK